MFYGPELWSVLVNNSSVFEKNVFCYLGEYSINDRWNWLIVFQVFYIFTDHFLSLFYERPLL